MEKNFMYITGLFFVSVVMSHNFSDLKDTHMSPVFTAQKTLTAEEINAINAINGEYLEEQKLDQKTEKQTTKFEVAYD